MSLYYNTKFNKYVRDDAPFEIDGVQYAGNWFQLVSKQDVANAGFELVVASNQRADDRFYWVSETLDKATLTYTNTPKDLEELKKNGVSQLNSTAYSLLFPSDWMVIRAAEGTPITADWTAYRSAVRTTANTARTAIEASTDVDSLIAASNIDWPKDPNYVPPVEEQTPANGVV